MVVRLVLLVVFAALGCGGAPKYEESLVCGDSSPERCPPGQPCPSVPPESTYCRGARLGTDVDPSLSVPSGCVVSLPFGTHTDAGTVQAACTCSQCGLQMDAGPEPWWCCNYQLPEIP